MLMSAKINEFYWPVFSLLIKRPCEIRSDSKTVRIKGIYPYLPIMYRGANKSLARPTPRCILFDG